MAMAKVIIKTLRGIDRPALASFMPNPSGKSLMLDLGANVECVPDHLTKFALMGDVFAKDVLGIPSPSVGLLNVGAEDLKGHSAVKETYQFLREAEWLDNFYGFIEGDDIFTGIVDVIVTDGFTGNIALKSAEGTFKMVKTFLETNFKSSLSAKLGYLCVKPVLKKLQYQLDPRRYNGAIFLGLNGVAVKSHGNADAVGFSYAIKVAIEMARRQVNQHISQGLAKWHAGQEQQFASKTLKCDPSIKADLALAS